MALKRLRTRVQWVKKYLKPNTTLTTIDQLYDTQKIDNEGTVGEKIPNTTLKTYWVNIIDQLCDTQKIEDEGMPQETCAQIFA